MERITALTEIQIQMSFRRLSAALVKIHEKPSAQYVLLATITLLAAALRFYKLGEWSFWIDEIFTISRAQTHFSEPISIVRNFSSAPWLPLSVILTNGFLNIFGVNEWSARLASALIGILSIPILFFTARKLAGPGVALIVTLLLSISPWHLLWSQNARFYTSLMLIYSMALFAFFYAFERDRPIFIAIFYALVYFAVSERLIAILIFPVALVYLGLLWIFPFDRPTGFNRRNLLLLFLPMLLLAVLDALRYLVTGSSIALFAFDAFAGQQFDDPVRLAVAIGFNLGIPIICLGLAGGMYLLQKKSRIGLFLLASAVLPVALLVILNPIIFTKDRYVFMTLPSWLVLAAISVNELISHSKDWGKVLALGVLVVLVTEAAGTNLLYYHVNHGGRRDWRAAFEIIKEKSRADDAVVAWWPEFGPYYLGKEIIPWKDIQPNTVTASGKRYWFLVDSETIWGNLEMRDWVLKHAELIEVLYLRMPEDDFNLRLYLYDPVKIESGN